jgi:hypothetical protein
LKEVILLKLEVPPPIKTLRVRHYALQQVTQFTMLNRVLDPLASTINDCLRRPTVCLHSLERSYLAAH